MKPPSRTITEYTKYVYIYTSCYVCQSLLKPWTFHGCIVRRVVQLQIQAVIEVTWL